MSRDGGRIPKRETHKTDGHRKLDDYRAVQMLNRETKGPKKRKSAAGIRTQEEVERILEKVEHARHLINTEPEKAKCEICERKNVDKNMKISKDNKKGIQTTEPTT